MQTSRQLMWMKKPTKGDLSNTSCITGYQNSRTCATPSQMSLTSVIMSPISRRQERQVFLRNRHGYEDDGIARKEISTQASRASFYVDNYLTSPKMSPRFATNRFTRTIPHIALCRPSYTPSLQSAAVNIFPSG